MLPTLLPYSDATENGWKSRHIGCCITNVYCASRLYPGRDLGLVAYQCVLCIKAVSWPGPWSCCTSMCTVHQGCILARTLVLLHINGICDGIHSYLLYSLLLTTSQQTCTATLHSLLEGLSFPNLPNMSGSSFSISTCTSTSGRLISESRIWWLEKVPC